MFLNKQPAANDFGPCLQSKSISDVLLRLLLFVGFLAALSLQLAQVANAANSDVIAEQQSSQKGDFSSAAANNEEGTASNKEQKGLEKQGGAAATGADAPVLHVTEEDSLKEGPGMVKKSVNWLVESRDIVAENLIVAADGIDRFFVGVDTEDAINGSFLRIRLSQRFDKGGVVTFEEKFKVKLDLPMTEDRLKLVFETDSEDKESLLDQNRDIPTEDVRIGDSGGASGAMQFLLSERRKWKVNFDAGVRTPLPLDPFTRLRFKREKKIDEFWTARFKQNFYYYNSDGFGQKSQLFFERPISKSYFLQNKMEAKFEDEDNRFEFAQVLTTYHIFDDKHSINYNVGILGENRPVPRVSGYFISASFTKRLYKHWLFLTLIPDFYFPREGGFDLSPSFTARLDILFADEKAN